MAKQIQTKQSLSTSPKQPTKQTKQTKPSKRTPEEAKQYKKIERYEAIVSQYRVINFKGQTLYLDTTDSHTSHNIPTFRPLTSDAFAAIAYKVHPGALVQQIKELEHITRIQAPSANHLANRVAVDEHLDWDTIALATVPADPDTVFRTAYPVASLPADADNIQAARDFMLQLADGDADLASDITQGIAPLFMGRKPAGVVWFVGTGANGKSALINAIYRLLGPHLSSLTVAAIEDGRDTPRLNGMLGNVCRESSESRVGDTERYKAIGTHEPFDVHKFHSQDTIRVTGDLHHIFNANNIPVFGDKTQGARRRTLIIPFPARFKDDPTFEDRTFTPGFLSGLLAIILEATHVIRDNGYQYRFSAQTQRAKDSYDSEVNSAEAFLKYLVEQRVEAFSNYTMLEMAYRHWCSAEGMVPLGVTNLRRIMETQARVERKTVRLKEAANSGKTAKTTKWFFLAGSETPPSELVTMDGTGLHVRAPNDKEAHMLEHEQQELAGEGIWFS